MISLFAARDIGLALQASGLHPYVKGRFNHFGIYRGGNVPFRKTVLKDPDADNLWLKGQKAS